MTPRVLLLLILLVLPGCSRKPEKPIPPSARPLPLTEVGRFQVESGILVVIDPGYLLREVKTLGASVPSARKGGWIASVAYVTSKEWGTRCAELYVRHESLPNTQGATWLRQEGLIGVDSGQAGVFDEKHFRRKEVVPKNHAWKEPPVDPDDPWYSLCCDQTLGTLRAGAIPFGSVSSSGFGDGAYEWDLLRAGSDVVAVRVIFIPEDER